MQEKGGIGAVSRDICVMLGRYVIVRRLRVSTSFFSDPEDNYVRIQ